MKWCSRSVNTLPIFKNPLKHTNIRAMQIQGENGLMADFVCFTLYANLDVKTSPETNVKRR